MKPLERKAQLKPDRLAKNALRRAAMEDMAAAGLPTTASVTIEYAGTRHTVTAHPIVSLKDGQIMFNFSATGGNRLAFSLGGQEYSFGLLGNILTGLAVECVDQVKAKYGLASEDDLEAGETTE